MEGQSILFARESTMPVAGEDLARALLLMRASTMKLLRLQLAIERRDRAVALQAMDDLVALDTRIAELLDRMPAGDDLAAIAREVDEQRSAVLREKFGLAAGLVRRGSSPMRGWAHSDQLAGENMDTDPAEDFDPPEVSLVEENPGRRHIGVLAMVLLLVAIASATGAFLFMDLQPETVLQHLYDLAGV